MTLKNRLILAMVSLIFLPVLALAILARLGITSNVPGEPLIRYVRLNRAALSHVAVEPGLAPTLKNRDKVPSWLGIALFDVDGRLVDTNLESINISREALPAAPGDMFSEFATLVRREYPNRRYVFEPIMMNGTTVGSYLALFRDRVTVSVGGIDRPAWTLQALAAILAMMVAISVAASVIVGRFSSTVRQLETAAGRIETGDLETAVVARGTREIVSLGKALERMRLAIREERDRRVRFIAAVSHDLKTPLTAILGYIEALEDGVAENPETAGRFLSVMRHKGELLDRRIADLLDFARVSTGEWRAKLEPVQLKPFIESLSRGYAADAESLGIHFSQELAIPDSVTVMLDRSLAARAIENVTANAFRYGARNSHVHLSLHEDKARYLLVIADSGPGIPKEDLPRVFDAYYRGSSSRREAGSGLGLYISKSIAQSHGWSLDILSEAGKGTTVVFGIPHDEGEIS